MTTIASFLSVSEGGERTLSMLSDSRITFSDGKTFDFSQKIFRLKQSLDVFGYSGSSLFSLSYLSQLISNLDYSLKFRNSKDILEKQGIVTEMLNEAFKNFPKAEVKRESCIYWNTYIENKFYSYTFQNDIRTDLFNPIQNDIPNETGLVFRSGSGNGYYLNALENLEYKKLVYGKLLNNVSRTYFVALMDVIKSGIDPKTGGPPQMTIIRGGRNDINSTGFLFNEKYYLHGTIDKYESDTDQVEYRDIHFNFLTPDGKAKNNYKDSLTRRRNLEQWKEWILSMKKKA